jgi:hypothetical protein
MPSSHKAILRAIHFTSGPRSIDEGDDDYNDDVHFRLQHGKGIHNLV